MWLKNSKHFASWNAARIVTYTMVHTHEQRQEVGIVPMVIVGVKSTKRDLAIPTYRLVQYQNVCIMYIKSEIKTSNRKARKIYIKRVRISIKETGCTLHANLLGTHLGETFFICDFGVKQLSNKPFQGSLYSAANAKTESEESFFSTRTSYNHRPIKILLLLRLDRWSRMTFVAFRAKVAAACNEFWYPSVSGRSRRHTYYKHFCLTIKRVDI
jgi:hypothetical protein